MFYLRKAVIALAVAAIAALSVVTAPAEELEEDWLDELMLQLAIEEACDVVHLFSFREDRIDSNILVEAKVQCEDGRTFDASRLEPAERFDIRICDIVELVC